MTSSRHRGRTIRIVRQPRPKYAYSLSLFLMHAPSFDKSPLDQQTSEKIARAWDRGIADSYPARTLVRAGIVSYHPLRGGIFYRREPVKYIVLHSTETGVPVSAVNVIEGWSSMGRRHPGAQYVVERDGTIYQAVDPDLATVHVNIFKTLPGINNDNSIGIEMNHTGRQNYPAAQREAVSKLLAYLQGRYQVENANVITHRYAQQGDHTDPVNFDLEGFLAYKNQFQKQALAYKVKGLEKEVKTWNEPAAASTMLQPHPVQVDVVERQDKKVEKTEKVKVLPLPGSEEPVRTAQPVNGLELKGPIEVDPSSASDLNQKEVFEVDGPGATKGGEAPAAAPKFAPGPDSAPESKLSTPHTRFAPAHVINQLPKKEVESSAHKTAAPAPHKEVITRKSIDEIPLSQYVPGDKTERAHTKPAAPRAVAAQTPQEVESVQPKDLKPTVKKSMFQRFRTYIKENFQ
ncbi:MAG TPA: peptidoglycan recognition family protein [Candidatus Melainabacteria bacterium]|nr:peptidoglycan recognition family protein [Candidatus Melainabacteria bacterium]